MNVLQMMSDSYLPTITGNSFSLEAFNKLVNGFANSILFLWNKGDRPEYEKYKGTPIYNPRGSRWDVFKGLRDVVEKEDIDVILTHDYSTGHITVANSIVKVPKIDVIHGYNSEAWRYKGVFEHIFVYHSKDIPHYVEEQGISESKISQCIPPLDTGLFHPREGVVEKEERSILFVGRVIRGKNLHKLVPRLEDLDANLTIVGPLDKDEEYVNTLKNVIKENKMGNRVKFKGVLRGEEKAREYNRHDVLLQLSSFDCFSLVLRECIASGLPAVAYELDGAYSWVEDGVFIENNLTSVLDTTKKLLDGEIEFEFNEDSAERLSFENWRPHFRKVLENVVENYDLESAKERLLVEKTSKEFEWRM